MQNLNKYLQQPERSDDKLLFVPSECENKISDHVFTNIESWENKVRLCKNVHDYITGQVFSMPVTNPLGKQPFTLFKYMPASRFLGDIDKAGKGRIAFVSPDMWKDPFESIFYKPKCEIQGREYDVACVCMTYDKTATEETGWNTYVKNDEKGVRVAYNFKKLCDLLETWGIQKNVTFYISIVDYTQERKDLERAARYYEKQGASYKSLLHYLNILSLKRRAFSYENEVRIFAVKEYAVDSMEEEWRTPLFVDGFAYNDLVSEVLMSPMKPIKRQDKRFPFYAQMQDIDNFDLRVNLEETFKEKVHQSRLYLIGRKRMLK